jgi:arylsulfatase A-like enzyme/Tfp pilus assembly protein PilF
MNSESNLTGKKSRKPAPARSGAALLGLGVIGILGLVVIYIWWSGGGESRPFRGNTSAYNVLLVTMDTTRADHLGSYGNGNVRTPILDGLADAGVLFENAYSPAVMTLPSHASIHTGLLPPAHGVRDNGTYQLSAGVETLAEVLKAAGYNTGAAVGAVVLDSMFGLEQGFDFYDDNLPASGPHDTFFSQRNAGRVTDASLGWLATVKDSRWFLWAHYFDPHSPYQPPQPYRQQYQDNPYDGEIAYMDGEIGRLLEGIRKDGAGERTIVVVVADHGEGFRDHGEQSHGVFLYDETSRVPLIISVPGYTEDAVRVKAVVRTTDIMPTILDLLRMPRRQGSQGSTLWPLMSGTVEDLNLEAYAEAPTPALTYSWSPLASIRAGKWKYIHAPTAELYDMESDPGERNNVLAAEGVVAENLRSRLQQILADPGMAGGAENLNLSPEEQARLRSLGYVSGGGSSFRQQLEKDPALIMAGAELGLVDPKRQIGLLDRVNRISLAYGRGEFSTSLRLAEEMLELFPNNDHVRQYAADALRGLKRFDESLAYYRIILQKDQGNIDALLNVGWVLMNLERFEEATETFEKALRIYPGHVFALSSLGDISFIQGDLGQATRRYRELLLERPSHLKSILAMAKIFEQRGLREEAKVSYRRATELAPRDLDSQLSLAWLQFGDKEYDDALETLGAAAAQDPGMAELNLYRGDIYFATGRLKEAASEYQLGVKKAPQAPQGYHGLGMIASRRGEKVEARRLFEEALRLDPGYTASRQELQRLGTGG